jgi:hypothetical protein
MASTKAATAAGGLLFATVAAGGVIFVTTPKSPQQHRGFNGVDSAHMRDVKLGRPVPAASNPGVRVEPSFVSPEEARLLIQEAGQLMREYGCSHLDNRLRQEYQRQALQVWGGGKHANVNMKRVTGRFERDEQRIAPWKYGDEFDASKAPPTIRTVLQRIVDSPAFDVEKARDITLNYRKDGFYRLDPHLDPESDGASDEDLLQIKSRFAYGLSNIGHDS